MQLRLILGHDRLSVSFLVGRLYVVRTYNPTPPLVRSLLPFQVVLLQRQLGEAMAELQSNRERLAEVQAMQVGMDSVSLSARATWLHQPNKCMRQLCIARATWLHQPKNMHETALLGFGDVCQRRAMLSLVREVVLLCVA